MERDHAEVIRSIRDILVQSATDRPALAKAMLKSQVLFTFLLFAIRFRLAVAAFSPANVDARPLISLL